MMLLVQSCSSPGPAPSPVASKADVFCQTQQPIILNRDAILKLDSAGVKRVLAFNKFGADHCGWKPGGAG